MRWHRLLVSCLAIAAPQFALADLPMSKQALGQVEGILKFCTEVDPASAEFYSAQSAALVSKANAKDLADARKSAAYQEAYDSISAELAKLDKDHAARTCSGMKQGQ